jgi:hypothetical protein
VNFNENFLDARTSLLTDARSRKVINSCYIAPDAVFQALSIGGSPTKNGPKMVEKTQKYKKVDF